MKFSVLIPVYNTSEYLEQCLSSVLNQTYDDYEVIIVNDGSTDNSRALCDEYQKDYPSKITVINQENQGLISARRNAIKVAKGEYCIFVDSDDYVDTNLLESINSFISKNDVDVAIYSFRYVRNGIAQETFKRVADDGTIWSGENKKTLYEMLLFSNDVTSIWTKAVRTEVLKKDPTDYTEYLHKNMAEDLLQTMAIFTYADTIGYFFEPKYMYRINENSVSRSFKPQTIHSKNTLHVYNKAKEYLGIWGLDDEEHNKRLNARWFNETFYMFSRYIECASNKKEKVTVFNADWNSLLPDEVKDNRNDYENKTYQDFYKYFQDKNFNKMNNYFIRKKIYRVCRNIKRRIIKGKYNAK